MSDPNRKPSVIYPAKNLIAPASIAAAGNAVSGWVDCKDAIGYISLVILLGALGGGTLSVDILQATSAAGAGAKALITGAVVGLATNNATAQFDFRPDDILDLDPNGFRFIQVKINNVGGTGAIAGAAVLAGPARFQS